MEQLEMKFAKPLAISRAERVMELCDNLGYPYREFELHDDRDEIALEFESETVIINETDLVTIITQSEVIYEKWEHFIFRLLMA